MHAQEHLWGVWPGTMLSVLDLHFGEDLQTAQGDVHAIALHRLTLWNLRVAGGRLERGGGAPRGGPQCAARRAVGGGAEAAERPAASAPGAWKEPANML